MNFTAPVGVEASVQRTTNRAFKAAVDVKSKVTLTAVTKTLAKNWWLIALYIVLEFVGAGVGAALSGLSSFLVSLGFDALTTVIGLYAVIRVVREMTREA